MLTRVAVGRARVVAEVRAAGPLMAELAAPLTARGPWLTAVLNEQSARLLPAARPRAVVVGSPQPGRPAGIALLALRRRGPVTAVSLLGDGVGPLPGGGPTSRLPARDEDAADRLAAAVAADLARIRGPWTMRLAGLPLGDPTVRRLAAALTTAELSTHRTRRLVDDLDSRGAVRRSRDPVEVERWLPVLLARLPAGQRRPARAVARLHAAADRVEVAVLPGAGRPAAVLLTLLEGADADVRVPWWGCSGVGGLDRELGTPAVTLTATGGLRRASRRA